jgi:hypothetical protein
MLYRDVKAAIKRWIESRVMVDTWTPEPPRFMLREYNGVTYPTCTGFLGTIRDVYVLKTADSTYPTKFTLPFFAVWRFHSDVTEQSLPITEVEVLYTNLIAEWVSLDASVHPDVQLTDIEDGADSPVKVARLDELNNDWLILMSIDFTIQGILDIDDVGIIQPPDFNEDTGTPIAVNVNAALWRSKIEYLGDTSGSELDANINL